MRAIQVHRLREYLDGQNSISDWDYVSWLIFLSFVNNLLQIDTSDENTLRLLEVPFNKYVCCSDHSGVRAPLSVVGVVVCSILSQAMSHHSLESWAMTVLDN